MKVEIASDAETDKSIGLIEKFKLTYYPQIKEEQWNNWKWQLSNSIKTTTQLQTFFNITNEENVDSTKLPLRITPYYLSLIYNSAELRKTMVSTINEFKKGFGEKQDPLGENDDSPLPGLIHRYPDRVLFLVTDFCASNCRYCTRSRIIEKGVEKIDYDAIINYIRKHSEIRDVILSGGDPLTLSDERIDYLLKSIREISHVEIIRIGTKVPFVLPQRITDNLVDILKKFHPLFISIHSTHPDEITEESKNAVEKLANAGIVLGSQTVLLKEVNNNAETLKKLFHELLKMRIRPYYLYQCDPVVGSHHFKTEIKEGLDIIQSLRGFTSGYAIPQYVIDAPGGGGKIPILPNSIVLEDKNYIYLKNYEQEIFKYPV
jgi:lysine 2,3-aminomutase